MKTDGTDIQQISNQHVWFSTIENEYIYYSNEDDDRKIYKLKIDGSENKKIANTEDVWEQYIVNDLIYYSISLGDVYRMKKDGSQNSLMVDFSKIDRESWNIDGEWIYYKDLNSNKLYRIQTNGSNKQIFE